VTQAAVAGDVDSAEGIQSDPTVSDPGQGASQVLGVGDDEAVYPIIEVANDRIEERGQFIGAAQPMRRALPIRRWPTSTSP
jgi:hypothetical protein